MMAAARRSGWRFSITARKDRAFTAAITSILDDTWTAIAHPTAVFNDELQRLVSDAEFAEFAYTAFTAANRQGHCSLIVRRVGDAKPQHTVKNRRANCSGCGGSTLLLTDSHSASAKTVASPQDVLTMAFHTTRGNPSVATPPNYPRRQPAMAPSSSAW
ncbi:hypothetical protein ACVBEQ_10960 [Nakamurella sp. GG22]